MWERGKREKEERSKDEPVDYHKDSIKEWHLGDTGSKGKTQSKQNTTKQMKNQKTKSNSTRWQD